MPNSASDTSQRQPEIIAFCSGKGGTGKTITAACLGYALTKAGLRVLMVDADTGTDGLSLFLLGAQGLEQIGKFQESETVAGIMAQYETTKEILVEPKRINRDLYDDDHQIRYRVLISNKGLYGDNFEQSNALTAPVLNREVYRGAIESLFDKIRNGEAGGDYDYVIVDTRGGFSFHTTDVCALSDSFILVTEADYTSFHQDRNLVHRISATASELGQTSLLRAVIVNKATEGISDEMTLRLKRSSWDHVEEKFRNALTAEFPLEYNDTYAFPLDMGAVLSYKSQQIPYLAQRESLFSYSSLLAFGSIMGVVTQSWSEDVISNWNAMVSDVSKAAREWVDRETKKREQEGIDRERLVSTEQDRDRLRDKIEYLQRDIEVLTQQAEKSESYASSIADIGEGRFQQYAEALEDKVKSTRRMGSFISLFAAVAGLTLGLLGYFALDRFVLLDNLQQESVGEVQSALDDPLPNSALDPLDLIAEAKLAAFNRRLEKSQRESSIRFLLSEEHCGFENLNISGINLTEFTLVNCSFIGSVMPGVDFRYTRMSNVRFDYGDFPKSRFDLTTLIDVSFVGADLLGASFVDARFRNVDFSSSNLIDVKLSKEQISQIRCNENTKASDRALLVHCSNSRTAQ